MNVADQDTILYTVYYSIIGAQNCEPPHLKIVQGTGTIRLREKCTPGRVMPRHGRVIWWHRLY